jgi:Fic family protein
VRLLDPLIGRQIVLDGDVAADVADAESALHRLNNSAVALADTEALARLLLRAESVASSHIEGLVIGGRRLLRAEVARSLGSSGTDVTADEVLGNVEAMTWAVDALTSAPRITVAGLLEVHRLLLAPTRLAEHAGRIRTEQNWIGGSSSNPCSAAFVPPPPEHVHELLVDLCQFANTDDLPTVAHAAIAHAQFETIHPFVDGNGRTGRALIHVILRRRGLVPRLLPPISLVLATWSASYLQGLDATRYRGRADSAVARAGLNRWIALFATATRRAVDDALGLERHIEEIEQQWRAALGRVRADSAVALLLAALPGAPIITVNSAASLIGRSYEATNEAIRRLCRAGVIRQVTVGQRNRAYEAEAIIDAFTALERQLASPAGDTRSAPPERPAPARPRRR